MSSSVRWLIFAVILYMGYVVFYVKSGPSKDATYDNTTSQRIMQPDDGQMSEDSVTPPEADAKHYGYDRPLTSRTNSTRSGGWGEGHEAGYEWAEKNDVDDERVCEDAGVRSNSPSFVEGCEDYVLESN